MSASRPRTASDRGARFDHLADDARPWLVIVDGDRARLWGQYVSRAGALAVVRQLHAQGFAAHVEGPQ